MLPQKIKPMEPVLITDPFDSEDYLYQVKWDGIRIITYISSQGLKMYTKKGNARIETYPELKAVQQQFTGTSAILDGEVVVLNEQGVPDFQRVLKRDLAKGRGQGLQDRYPVMYVVFDIIYLNDRSITKEPLCNRQELLASFLKESQIIRLCDSYDKGIELFKVMQDKGMEGIVAKEKRGLYYLGERNNTWLKIKCFRQLDAVIGGVALKGRRVSALLLGLYNDEKLADNDKLIYIGKVSTGLNNNYLAQLQDIVEKYRRGEAPFQSTSLPEKKVDSIAWLPPILTVRVKYIDRSEGGLLRQPVIVGFCEKEAGECRLK